jgi:NHL repeat
MRTTFFSNGTRPRPAWLGLALAAVMGVWLSLGSASALAAAEPHPQVGEFGSFSNPNGIAIDESTGDVYVSDMGVNETQAVSIEGGPTGGSFTLEFEGQKTSALTVSGTSSPTASEVQSALEALGTIGGSNVTVSESGALPGTVIYTVTFEGALASKDVPVLVCDGTALTGGTSHACTDTTVTAGIQGKVSRFDASGVPVDFFTLGSNELTGQLTPAGPFAFPTRAYGTPAAIAVDNSKSPSDPSAGDLYVMDARHGVIDKFSPSGEYLNQITSFAPATGSSENELLGLALDASGKLRVDLRGPAFGVIVIDVFDGTSANHLVARQLNKNLGAADSGVPSNTFQEAHGFAVGPTGDDYLLYESCSCVVKLGQQTAGLGQVDNAPSGDVALAADPATGHLYSDSQSSIAEWDTGAMNGSERGVGAAVRVGASFGALSGSSGQGGIAVNGSNGRIYVSDPGAGKVDVFGSDFPAVTAGAANEATKKTARLNGTVDPRGVAITECKFEYGVADEFGRGAYEHSVSCEPAAAGIGSGSIPVPVSAHIEGLEPGLLYRFRLYAANAGGSNESSGLVATEGVGFGVKNFSVSFLNEDGTPDTQAGSHPYEMVNSIEFNSHFMRLESNADSPFVREPDGTLKDLALDLPPGLVGNPNATPKKCTLSL